MIKTAVKALLLTLCLSLSASIALADPDDKNSSVGTFPSITKELEASGEEVQLIGVGRENDKQSIKNQQDEKKSRDGQEFDTEDRDQRNGGHAYEKEKEDSDVFTQPNPNLATKQELEATKQQVKDLESILDIGKIAASLVVTANLVAMGFLTKGYLDNKTMLRSLEANLKNLQKAKKNLERNEEVNPYLPDNENNSPRGTPNIGYTLNQPTKEKHFVEQSSNQHVSNAGFKARPMDDGAVAKYDQVKTSSSFPNTTHSRSIGNSTIDAKLKQIAQSFNDMMAEVKAAGIGGGLIKNQFMRDNQVTAFKCINYEERLLRPNDPPKFAICKPNESTLWGVPIQDGGASYLAVLPSLAAYEKVAHNQGGLRELFVSDYISGSYRNIKVDRPAIMTHDFRTVVSRGELSLS